MSTKKKYSRKRGSFKNGFEAKIYKEMERVLGPLLYEPFTFHYRVEETRRYTPDFFVKGSNGLYIEGKGKFTGADRKKMLLVKEQHPDMEFRFYFVSGNKKLSKRSNTTYGDWCDKHGFKWTDLKQGATKWKVDQQRKTGKSSVTKNRQSSKKSSGSIQLCETPGS